LSTAVHDEQEKHEDPQHLEKHRVTDQKVGTSASSTMEEVAWEVTFPMEHEAPARAGGTTATAVSPYSALIAIGIRKQQSADMAPPWHDERAKEHQGSSCKALSQNG